MSFLDNSKKLREQHMNKIINTGKKKHIQSVYSMNKTELSSQGKTPTSDKNISTKKKS
jgi:hypothetical protein